MNARERFLAIMSFEPADRMLKWEFGYWGGALRRWYAEGLPLKHGLDPTWGDGQGVRGEGSAWDDERPRGLDVHDYFRLDEGMRRIPLNVFLCPRFEPKVLEEHDDWFLLLDDMGVIKKERKDRATLPHFVGWPVTCREDWERIKAERLQPTLAGRLPDDWPSVLQELKGRDYPLGLGSGIGFFGTPRFLLGPENLLMAYIDQPDLVQDMVSYLADFWISLFDQILNQVDADLALIWEDMAYKTGPLISPAMFRKFMLPGYKKVTGFLRDRGVRNVHVDTDGNCWSLLPLFIEGGVTGLYPFEVMAGMDVVEVRRAFPELQILGGIDKTMVAAGRTAIDSELEAKVPSLLKLGGYIPYIDHLVPSDVSWDNFSYYRTRLDQLIDAAV